MAIPKVRKIFESSSDKHYFFGYFNRNQISACDTKILGTEVGFIDRLPEAKDVARIGFFDLRDTTRKFHVIGETKAFNWQQGCMLQFIHQEKDVVIYNSFSNGKYSAFIQTLSGRQIREVPAVYAVRSDGQYAVTIDFERHYWCRRGYSYGNVVNKLKNKPVVPGDGVWEVCLKSGATRKIVDLQQLLLIQPLPSMQNAVHYCEHMEYSPDGKQMIFLHRWRHENGIHSRLFKYNFRDDDLSILVDSGRMSHYCWINDTQVLAYGALGNPLNRFRTRGGVAKHIFKRILPIYKVLTPDSSKLSKILTGDSYLIIDVSDSATHRSVLPQLRSLDGHPSAIMGSKLIVTDTYSRLALKEKARLIIADLETHESLIVDELNSIEQYDETAIRCDLHPRISASGKLISIDTMDRGVRGIYVYSISECHQ